MNVAVKKNVIPEKFVNADERLRILSGIPFVFPTDKKPNGIPDKFCFVGCTAEDKIFWNDVSYKFKAANK
jgi:hypothetical protein